MYPDMLAEQCAFAIKDGEQTTKVAKSRLDHEHDVINLGVAALEKHV